MARLLALSACFLTAISVIRQHASLAREITMSIKVAVLRAAREATTRQLLPANLAAQAAQNA